MTTQPSTSRAPWRASVLFAALALAHCSAPSLSPVPDPVPKPQTEREERERKDSSGAAQDAQQDQDDETRANSKDHGGPSPEPARRGVGPVDFKAPPEPVERPAESLSVESEEGDDFEGDPFESTDFEGDDFEEDPRDLIESLEKDIGLKITDYREEFGVEDFTAPTPDSCDKVCDLSAAICRSSTRICAISGDHPAEVWFAERCHWSSKECRHSNDQCESCTR